jgi:LPS-assembly lipoprotein
MPKVFRTLALCAAVALPAFSLSGCGFVPLYAQQGLTINMAQIAIDAPQTRTGYFVEQELRNRLASDDSTQKLYKLVITMKEQHYSIGYRVDDTSTRSEITSQIAYKLINVSTKAVILKDAFSETVTYDTSVSPFTGVISQQDAQKRIATSISQKIQTDLALYFHEQPKP